MKLEINLPSLSKFYEEIEILETDDRTYYDRLKFEENPGFIGLTLREIHKCKYSYTQGLDALHDIEEDIILGGGSHKYKYDDLDGDEMSYDRYMEGIPCLKKRVRTHGVGSGKFITIHINTSENAGIEYEEMLHKAYTAIRIVDFLENLGYRTKVMVYNATQNLGYLTKARGGKMIEYIKISIPIKEFNESLNKGLILTAISPWFERYWMFLYQLAKFNCCPGLGQAVDERLPDSMTNIYIKQGDCLNKYSSEYKIKSIIAKFNT